MPAAQYDLNVDRGSTFKVTLDLEDTANDPVDLTNYTAEMQVRRSINDDKMVCRLTTAWPQGCFGPSIAGEFEKGNGVTGYTGGIVLNYQGVTGKILIQIDSKSSYWSFEKPRSFYDLRLTNNADNSVTSIIKGEIRSSATLIDTERSPASFAESPTPSATGTTAGIPVSINASVIGFPTPVSTYYWIQNSYVISGATGSSYTPTASGPLLGHITVTNNEGFSGATVDFGTIVAVDGEFAPFFTGTPSASSTDVFTGTQVTIDNVGATGSPEPSTSYQWTQNSSVIIGETSQSYTPSATGPLSGNVTISNSQGSTGVTVDFGTVSVEPAAFAPSFTGTPSASVVGQTAGFAVSIQNVGATGYPPPSTTYYWTQNGSVIGGASSQTYYPSNTGPLSGNVTVTNPSGSTGVTVDFGTIVAGPSSGTVSMTYSLTHIGYPEP